MALVNRSRVGSRHQKRRISVASATIVPADFNVSLDVTELFLIPEDSFLIAMKAQVKTAFDAGTSIDMVTELDGSALIDSISLLTTGFKSAVFTKALITEPGLITIIPTIVGALPTVGELELTISYIEYTKHDGELTNLIEGV